jgi:hypothetical protein
VAAETDTHAISTLRRSKDNLVLIASSISRYCLNKQRSQPELPSHERSRVYFLVRRDSASDESNAFISQRCHSKNVYAGTKCSEYSSKSLALPRNITQLLWPPRVKTADDVLHEELVSLEASLMQQPLAAAGAGAGAGAAQPPPRRRPMAGAGAAPPRRESARMTELRLLRLTVQIHVATKNMESAAEVEEDNSLDGRGGKAAAAADSDEEDRD